MPISKNHGFDENDLGRFLDFPMKKQIYKWCTHPAKVHFILHPESVISHHSNDENLGMRTHMEHQ